MRAAATGELAHHWPEAQGLLPPGFGREVDRYCVLELERSLEAGAEPPDAPAELADAVSALRLATGAPLPPGRCCSSGSTGGRSGSGRRCRSPRRSLRARRRVSTRSAPSSRASCVARLSLADADVSLAEALDRWELSLFQHEPFRSEQLRGALGGAARRDVGAACGGAARRAERRAAGDPRGAPVARRRASRRRRARRRRYGARWSRRCVTAIGSKLARARSTTRCSGCGRRRSSPGRRSRAARIHASVTKA